MTASSRRFRQPWSVDESTESFCIREANGQGLAYVYFEEPVFSGRGKRLRQLEHLAQVE